MLFFFILVILILGFLCCISETNVFLIRFVSFFGSLFLFLGALFFWLFFNTNLLVLPQFLSCLSWFQEYSVCFGLDGFSFFFFLLTTFIHFICVLSAIQSVRLGLKYYFVLLFFLEFLLFCCFSVTDFFCFYIFFEALLVPMFLLIGVWGSNPRKVKAAYYLFIYTLFGSLFLLLSLLLLGLQVGSFNWFLLCSTEFSFTRELLLWPGLFLSFAIKIPMIPFHIWLPEAHVEAPTGGSIILASLLLKLGFFGFIRYLFPILPQATFYYSPVVIVLAVVSIFYSALAALRQVDLKRIVAYSSIAHMNFGIVGLFSLVADGICGSYLLMLGHGFVSGALFFLIGVLYERYKTRICFYYSGLVVRMPLFCFFLFFFSIANIAFPGTINFISEILIFFGVVLSNVVVCFFILLSLGLTTVFTFWLYNRLSFGTVKVHWVDEVVPDQLYYSTTLLIFDEDTGEDSLITVPDFERPYFERRFFYLFDLTLLEFCVLFFLLGLTVGFGLFPNLLLLVFKSGGFYFSV